MSDVTRRTDRLRCLATCSRTGPSSALDLAQHGLAGHAERGCRVVEAEPAVGDLGLDPFAQGSALRPSGSCARPNAAD